MPCLSRSAAELSIGSAIWGRIYLELISYEVTAIAPDVNCIHAGARRGLPCDQGNSGACGTCFQRRLGAACTPVQIQRQHCSLFPSRLAQAALTLALPSMCCS